MAATVDSFEVLLLDGEEQTAAALREHFLAHRRPAPRWLKDTARAAEAVLASTIDALLLDVHSHRPQDLEACTAVRALRPSLPIIALCAPGPALRRLQEWNAVTGAIDDIVAKPLVADTVFRALASVVQKRRMDQHAARIESRVTEEGRAWVGRARMSEAAILFTDIRRSTALASTLAAPELFEAINRTLTAQAKIVRRWQGSVIKFTGDGLLADFRGRGRSHFALRCALALQDEAARLPMNDIPIGVGVAEGLVMKGLIGEPGGQLFDVIGATVHLAARLCAIAAPGEVVATPRLMRAAALPVRPTRTQVVQLEGFPAPFECVSFSAGTRLPASHRDETALRA